METRKPHYLLQDIKATVALRGAGCFTATANEGYRALGISTAEALAMIAALSGANFYKSMTTHADHTQWQDVYHMPCKGGKTAYIKVTLKAGAVVISFKEKT
jgi:motility quorum-sensing regulator/GCU-specific mRNA interferase toxin